MNHTWRDLHRMSGRNDTSSFQVMEKLRFESHREVFYERPRLVQTADELVQGGLRR
jgi:hypothetical protein